MNVREPSQDFYKSYLTEGGYREKRFVQLGAREGISEQRALRSLNDGKVSPASFRTSGETAIIFFESPLRCPTEPMAGSTGFFLHRPAPKKGFVGGDGTTGSFLNGA